MIAERLRGRRIFVTGATGFVGTALTERILRGIPEAGVVLLVRDGRRRSAIERVRREILRNNAFDRLRDELGSDGFDTMATERIEVVVGDVGTDSLGLDAGGLEALATCDVVIHSAATVAFDAPLDRAVEINLLGPTRLAETIEAACGNHGSELPHLVSVSTCYVAGNRRGSAPEEPVRDNPFFVNIDWHDEVTASRRSRSDADALSRTADSLERFGTEARSALGPAGGPALAERTETLRTDWVHDTMVEAGRARATSLGWPDAYALTKALGEVALTSTTAGSSMAVTIVRPSIIESAFAEPSPGWIRGFRMAEPIILSYARGLLSEFPGVPEGIIDVIPVDMVVSGILAAAATPDMQRDGPRIVQVASGGVNPLRYQVLVDNVRDWFLEHPLHDEMGQPIMVPDWTFPGRGRVERQLRAATSAITTLERMVTNLPFRGRAAEWGSRLERKRAEAERALEYVTLYGAYTECEAVYGIESLLDLAETETASAGADAMVMDPRIIDWDRYISEIHLPSVVAHGRARTTSAKRDPDRRKRRLRAQVLDEQRELVAFDLENTLIASNVVGTYAWLAGRRLDTADRVRLVARLIAEAPSLLAADRADRSDFLRSFYRRYEGAPTEQIRADAAEAMSALLVSRSFPDAIRRVREHRRAGHRTVLITGAIDLVVEPLAPLFDDIICAETTREMRDGVEVLTGHLRHAPPTAEARAQVLRDLCARHGLDPAESVAYADSSSDLSMLEAVGFPVAVNPEPRLATIARTRGWLIEDFETAKGHRPPLLPLATRWRGTAPVIPRSVATTAAGREHPAPGIGGSR